MDLNLTIVIEEFKVNKTEQEDLSVHSTILSTPINNFQS